MARRQRQRTIRKESTRILPPLTDKSAFDLTEKEFDDLLGELCVTNGFCLMGDASRALWESKPETIDEFVEGLMRAEGMRVEKGSLHTVLKVTVQEFIAKRRAP